MNATSFRRDRDGERRLKLMLEALEGTKLTVGLAVLGAVVEYLHQSMPEDLRDIVLKHWLHRHRETPR